LVRDVENRGRCIGGEGAKPDSDEWECDAGDVSVDYEAGDARKEK